ncbi:MAG: peptide chain release factor N(5)-glutamine methyltransferase [Acidobacteriota bacterium]
MPSIAESLTEAESLLAAAGVAEPRREAISLSILATKKDRTFLYAYPEHILSDEEVKILDVLLRRRAGREPLQYISGVQEFFGLEFDVTPDVLIPRPETEMIVDRALEILRASDGGNFCDVGTGSGCIVVSILHELSRARGVGLDISRDALNVAARNAEKHGTSERLQLLESDLFSGLDTQKFDLIVSNPPYVPAGDMAELQAEVRDFEPHSALTDNSDGLSIIRRIVDEAPLFLASNGHLVIEMGIGQSDKVVAMFDKALWSSAELSHDLQGIPRIVSSRLI